MHPQSICRKGARRREITGARRVGERLTWHRGSTNELKRRCSTIDRWPGTLNHTYSLSHVPSVRGRNAPWDSFSMSFNLRFCRSVYYLACILHTCSCFTAYFTMLKKVFLWCVLHNMAKPVQWLLLCPVINSQSHIKKWYKHGLILGLARMSYASSKPTGIKQINAVFSTATELQNLAPSQACLDRV